MHEVAFAKFNYENVARVFKDVAFTVGCTPSTLQSVLWFTWRRIHMLESPQMDLFRSCSYDIDIDEVKPFQRSEEKKNEKDSGSSNSAS